LELIEIKHLETTQIIFKVLNLGVEVD